MSDAMPRPANPGHPTRQQLDDLEALMQRMLELPVNPLGEESTTPLPALPSLVIPEPDIIPVRGSKQPPDQKTETSEQTPASNANRSRTSIQPTGEQPPRVDHTRPTTGTRKPRKSWVIAPLVWTNLFFDRWAARLGRPGRWLRTPQGRTCLGLVGLLSLAGAIAWAILDIMSWTR